MRAKKDEGIREGGRGQIDSIREEISVLRMTLAEK